MDKELFDFGEKELVDDTEPTIEKGFVPIKEEKCQQLNLMGDVVELQKSLVERYVAPPFSVFDTRQGYWQTRRRAWLTLGIKSEVGRGENLLGFGEEIAKFGYPTNKDGSPKTKYGKCLPDGFDKEKYGEKMCQATSIFDPVLCEILIRWFAPKNGKILDPFAGGSVRGIVSAHMGYNYTGVDLRKEQVDANMEQAKANNLNPTWIVGDSINIDQLPGKFDFVFSCPPYYDLEVYSELPGELSNLSSYEDFLKSYGIIIQKCVDKLYDNRFAVFVVGNMRDKKGFYRDFVGDTIRLFVKTGALLYNEAVLINTAGSLPIRVNNQFKTNRKIGKMHQNVLVFYRGSVDKIREVFKDERQ